MTDNVNIPEYAQSIRAAFVADLITLCAKYHVPISLLGITINNSIPAGCVRSMGEGFVINKDGMALIKGVVVVGVRATVSAEVEKYKEAPLKPCPKCGKERDHAKPDPCLGYLPGVKAACCGHGVREPFIILDNGTKVEGWTAIEMFLPDEMKVKIRKGIRPIGSSTAFVDLAVLRGEDR